MAYKYYRVIGEQIDVYKRQAEYSAEEQKIKIRKKKFWRLINYKGKVDGTEKV